MTISKEVLMIGTGCGAAVADQWVDAINKACDKYAINTPKRIGAFLANVGVESGSLNKLQENLNYSAARMATVWPFRFALNPHASGTMQPNQDAFLCANNPQALGNKVYANRLGNGDAASGDGYKYRGHGLFQLTGHDNFAKYAKASGVDAVNNPDLLLTPDGAADSAAWYFSSTGCLSLADQDAFSATVKVINGVAPCDANQGPLRLQRYRDCVAAAPVAAPVVKKALPKAK